MKCLTQLKLHRAFRTDAWYKIPHHWCPTAGCSIVHPAEASCSPREGAYFELINPLALLSFKDSNATITPYLPVLFQVPLSKEIELREKHNKMRWLSLLEQIQFLLHKCWEVKLSHFQSLLRVLKFFSLALHFEVAPHEYHCQTIATLHLLTVSSIHEMTFKRLRAWKLISFLKSYISQQLFGCILDK